MSYHS